MKITILGCGSSLGVPALKYGWGVCDPKNPKNRRTRSSVIIEEAETVFYDNQDHFRSKGNEK